MRALAAHVPTERTDLLDTSGTGGGRSSFNVSTTAALIAAGAGCAVAKHGNRSATSRSGSADLLEALGARIDLGPAEVAACIEEAGFGFMFAPAHHQATRFVVPVRRELAVRTIFNLLGPLTNPAGARRQLIGVSDARFLERIAGALARLGVDRALVVAGEDGLDEVSASAPTRIVEVNGEEIDSYVLDPREVGIELGAGRGPRWPRGRHAGGERRGHARDPRAPARRRAARAGPRGRGDQRGRGDLRGRRRRDDRRGRGGRACRRERRKRRRGARALRAGKSPARAGRGALMGAGTVLERILTETRAEVQRRRRERPLESIVASASPAPERSFRDALAAPGIGVIAEFKRRSPSAGALAEEPDLATILAAYERGGAVAVSILTEGPNFDGTLEDLARPALPASCRCCARTSSSTPTSCTRRAPPAPTRCC